MSGATQARVVCREGIEGSFVDTANRVGESVGVTIDHEVLRRLSEGIGAVAEAEMQAAMARVARGQPAWADADAAVMEAPEGGVLAVEVDGVFVHCDDAWHEMKVVVVAPLGPGVEVDADTGRERLCWGRASYGAGFEEAQAFWGRAHVEAGRRGLGLPAVRTVVALGDGAPWIWRHAHAYLALPGVEVVEIIALYGPFSSSVRCYLPCRRTDELNGQYRGGRAPRKAPDGPPRGPERRVAHPESAVQDQPLVDPQPPADATTASLDATPDTLQDALGTLDVAALDVVARLRDLARLVVPGTRACDP